MEKDRIYYLLQGWKEGRLTEIEVRELSRFLAEAGNKELFVSIAEELVIDVPGEPAFDEALLPVLTNILAVDRDPLTGNTSGSVDVVVRRLPFPFTYWKRWVAAAAFILLAAGAWLQYGNNKQQKPAGISQTPQREILPGKSGAVLTLADGRKVVLDSLGNGVVAIQNGTRVVLQNGRLAYDAASKGALAVTYNTMSTPKGRQFRLMLPDGTQVWLNAASSITYPTVFAGKERRVEIKGEAYFEVKSLFAKGGHGKVPFIVTINPPLGGRSGQGEEVEVLGTHFDINAYPDEEVVKTTLLEGLVRVSGGQDYAVLQPGQQAQVSSSKKIKVVKNADTEKIMAWKNGLFNFEGAGIEEVMRQLSRWYDIDVVYEKGVPDINFVGTLDNNVSLSGVLKAFKGFGIHYRIEEGRRLVVLP